MKESTSTLAIELTRSIRGTSQTASNLLDIGLVVGGTIVLSLLAQVQIPLQPVPITGQSLGVLLIGAALGMHRGVAAVLLYLGLGAAGVPVYAGGVGIATLFGKTGGFLFAFLPAVAAVGYLSERKWDRRYLNALVAFLCGHLVIFAGGVAWLAAFVGIGNAITLGFVPFIPGMIIKTLVATCLLPFLWEISSLGSDGADDVGETNV